MFKLFLAILVGKLIRTLTRLLKVGGGSAAPGLYALKIEPDLISKLISKIPQNIVITGTNGKTTTSRILNHLVKAQNLKIIRNKSGSNLERGIASALIGHTNLFGELKDFDLGIWELDEAAFNKVVPKIKSQIIIFLNAFRDQLDRYGEVDTVVKKWQDSLSKMDWNPHLILNGNDQNINKLDTKFDQTIFGIPKLGYIGEQGGTKTSSKFDIEAKNIKSHSLEGTTFSLIFNHSSLNINLPLAGVYNILDFLAAFSAYYQLNLPVDEKLNESLQNFSPAFGRVEKINLPNNKEGIIFLIKNPTGASLVFETVAEEIKEKDTILMALNDNYADGTDVSWIWDAEFEKIAGAVIPAKAGIHANSSKTGSRIESGMTICSGTRAYDLALRLKYAGVNTKQLVIEPDLGKAFGKAQENLGGRLFILPTYTALLELQKILADKGHKKHYWKEQD